MMRRIGLIPGQGLACLDGEVLVHDTNRHGLFVEVHAGEARRWRSGLVGARERQMATQSIATSRSA